MKINSAKILRKKHAEGFGLLEAVVGVSIISLSLFGTMLAFQLSQQVVREAGRNTQASFLAEEGMEALKLLRDASWQNKLSPLSIGANYYLNFDGSSWLSSAGNSYIDGIFERKFILENVYRDANSDIAVSGALDQDARKATVYISWLGRNGTTTKSVSSYITNLFDN